MELKSVLESILFSAQQPMTARQLREILVAAADQTEDATVRAFKKTPVGNLETELEQLRLEHEQAQRSYRLACVAGAWQFISQPDFSPWIKALVGHKNRPPRLSQPALETLAIIAYRQPATRAEIEQVRGVSVDGVMQTLLERGLIEPVGRAEAAGRPITYGTTGAFLEYFGLTNLEDLPEADDLRRLPAAKNESLQTVDPGLATAPPEPLVQAESAEAVDPALAETPEGASPPDTEAVQPAPPGSPSPNPSPS